jgi:signal transduction histidine kinase
MLLKLMESSDQQINRLSRLIEDMLDVSRIRTGRFTLNLEQVNFTELVRSVVQRYQLELDKLNIEVKIIIKAQVNGCWDRLRIEQVLVNLLTNAIKYGERKAIYITVDSNEKNVRLIVEDHGIGITEKDQRRIFNRFERAVSTQNFGGLGLGLYIARQIVEAHNGHISVVSHPGMGSMFIIELPLSWPMVKIKTPDEHRGFLL